MKGLFTLGCLIYLGYWTTVGIFTWLAAEVLAVIARLLRKHVL